MGLSLWKTFRSDVDGGCASISMFVDIRRFLGLGADVSFGTGFQVCDLYIDDMSRKNLWQCATEIHEGGRAMPEAAFQRWSLWHRAFEFRISVQEFSSDLRSNRKCDMSLAINNNSKRELPDFGKEVC